MWKRENENVPAGNPSPMSVPHTSRPESEPAPRSASSSAASAASERAVLSPSIVVRGEVSGEEDLVIEGRIEGKILLRQNQVTVGAKGRVAAEIQARAIQIEGEVDGNLTAEEQVVLRRSSRVRGDITAPRVTIEDGARFKGSIDMEAKRATATVPAPARPAEKEPGPRPVEPKSAIQAG